MDPFQRLIKDLGKAIKALELPEDPGNLYDPIRYILDLGGKRIRPAALLLANQCFDGDREKALPAALAIEVFHNFTLMHDDIMDRAPLRRGKTTVHEKWNTTIAILSGDAMMVKAYQILEKVDPKYLIPVFTVFNKTALEVCEGQQYDMDFETRTDVTIPEYVEMIRLKTAVLLAASLKIGALTAGASQEDQDLLYAFGENLGLAFQLQDDLLDCFADSEKFGKQPGGDIIDNKKTFLLLSALRIAEPKVKTEILALIADNEEDKVEKMLAIYRNLEIDDLAKIEVQAYTDRSLAALKKVSIPQEKLKPLYDLAEALLVREN